MAPDFSFEENLIPHLAGHNVFNSTGKTYIRTFLYYMAHIIWVMLNESDNMIHIICSMVFFGINFILRHDNGPKNKMEQLRAIFAENKIQWNKKKLKVKLEERKDDPTYISMIKDIYKDQLDLIYVCQSLFIKEGFELVSRGFGLKTEDFPKSV